MEERVHLEIGADPYRPSYHFSPPYGWVQDPHPFFWKGRYHLFYQYDPKGVGRFCCEAHWGHAVSKDLLHWDYLPIVLSPGESGPDRNGCWSGSVIVNNGVPFIIYSGLVRRSLELEDRVSCLSQCLATGTKNLMHWKKHPENPILSEPPEAYKGMLNAWHDPHVWREGENWYMLLAGGYRDGSGGLVLLYRSSDLFNWEYLHSFCEGKRPGERWLVPDFFPLGDPQTRSRKFMLLYSEKTTQYQMGSYRDQHFYPETEGRVDYGPQFNAGRTLLDGRGRRILFGWISEDRPSGAYIEAGWGGMISLPRVLSLDPEGFLRIAAAGEVCASGKANVEYSDVELIPGRIWRVEDARGESFEPRAEVEVGEVDTVGLKLRCSPGGEEQTAIYYSPALRLLSLDRSRSSLDPDVGRSLDRASLDLNPDEPLRLHIFLDRSVVEVFAGSRVCLTGRIYPTREDSLGVELYAEGGGVVLRRLQVWSLPRSRS